MRVDHAPQQDVVARGKVVVDEPRGGARRVRDVELGGEFGAIRARAELPRLEAIAQEQRQRIEEDRLAGARFAGQHRKTGVELGVERLDDDKIANR